MCALLSLKLNKRPTEQNKIQESLGNATKIDLLPGMVMHNNHNPSVPGRQENHCLKENMGYAARHLVLKQERIESLCYNLSEKSQARDFSLNLIKEETCCFWLIRK